MTLTLADIGVLVGLYALIAAGLYALLRAEFDKKFGDLKAELSERIQRIEKELEYLRGRLDTIASFIEQLIGPAGRK